jgi:hypothetical protein
MSSVIAPVYKRNFMLLFDYFQKEHLKTKTRLTLNELLRKIHNIVNGAMAKWTDVAINGLPCRRYNLSYLEPTLLFIKLYSNYYV